DEREPLNRGGAVADLPGQRRRAGGQVDRVQAGRAADGQSGEPGAGREPACCTRVHSLRDGEPANGRGIDAQTRADLCGRSVGPVLRVKRVGGRAQPVERGDGRADLVVRVGRTVEGARGAGDGAVAAEVRSGGRAQAEVRAAEDDADLVGGRVEG